MKAIWQCLREYPMKDVKVKLPFLASFIKGTRTAAAIAGSNGMTDFNIHKADMVFIDLDRPPMPGDVALVSPREGDQPMLRQILVDQNNHEFCPHVSGTEPRADIYCTDPIIYGTVVYVKTNIKNAVQKNRSIQSWIIK